MPIFARLPYPSQAIECPSIGGPITSQRVAVVGLRVQNHACVHPLHYGDCLKRTSYDD